jgi:thymidylate kinase
MIETKLILVEGVPCSGKSTTAQTILNEITSCGMRGHCYLEWEEHNPIVIGKMEDLATIIATTKAREENVLQQWRQFTTQATRQAAVHIIESRFWQTDAMYLYLSGHSEEEIWESNRRVISSIAALDPVLIYLAPKDIEQLHTEIAQQRNTKWRASGKEGSWEEWGNNVYVQQKWFTDRSLNASAMAQFFNEWASIADRLFDKFPYRKLRIPDPQFDWEVTYGRIKDFLEVNAP